MSQWARWCCWSPALPVHRSAQGLLFALFFTCSLLCLLSFLLALFFICPPTSSRWSTRLVRQRSTWRQAMATTRCVRWARFCQVPLTNCWLKWLFQVRHPICSLLQVLLGQGAAAEVDDQEQWNALHCAAKVTKDIFAAVKCDQGGFLQVVVLLTNAGSTTTEKTSTGKTPLWYACIDQHKGCVEFLLR